MQQGKHRGQKTTVWSWSLLLPLHSFLGSNPGHHMCRCMQAPLLRRHLASPPSIFSFKRMTLGCHSTAAACIHAMEPCAAVLFRHHLGVQAATPELLLSGPWFEDPGQPGIRCFVVCAQWVTHSRFSLLLSQCAK